MNITLFGNRVFAGVIKFKLGQTSLGWVLNPLTGVFIRRDRFRDKGTARRRPCVKRAETAVIQLQAKK